MRTLSCDYVIVGAGTAGSVLAARLSEDPAVRVVVLEAGPARRGLLTRVPGTAFLASVAPRTNWNFTTEAIPGLNGRRLQWNQGRLLGGSSSINGMAYMRGHPRDYDSWERLGCSGWGWSGVLPFFRRAEASDRGAGAWHGGEGLLTIQRSRIALPICDAFLAAMAEAGYPTVDDLNAGVLEGFGRMDANIRGGRRWSTASAYLDPARRRPNLTVVADATASRIVVEGGRATGVAWQGPDGESLVEATREVILCGGGVKSPQLLLLSGIGPADELHALGIPVVRDLPGVGRNLHNHPSFALTYALKAPISAYRYLSPGNALAAGLRYLLTRGGPLSETYVGTGGLFATAPGLEVPDALVVMLPALTQRASVGTPFRDIVVRRHGFTVLASLARQASRGRVVLRSADPAAAPAIHPDFYDEPADMRTMVAMVRRLRSALRGRALAPLIEAELQLAGVPDEPAAIEAEIRAKGASFFHQGGTCRMGSDEAAVVDPRLRVRGLEGLRVADASVAPAPLNACMHAPCIMIGEKAAALILEDHAPPPAAAARLATHH